MKNSKLKTQNSKLICLLISVLCLLPVVGGCEMDSAQRVDLYKQAADKLSAASEQLDKQLAAIEIVMQESRAKLADPNLSNEATEKIISFIDQALAKKAEIIPVKTKIDTALEQIKAKLAEVQTGNETDISDEISIFSTALNATGTAVGGGIGQWILIGASILSSIGALIKANKEKHKSDKIISSVDSLLTSTLVTDKEQAKELLKDKQGTAIAAAVKKQKNS